ncbi:hypothetical protein M8J77_026013 [Diaphorina citri]|nr:hypothetical protein M8J77_026013 [Diaphorina citri]
MAVFMINICKFDRCGIIFKNLADLIQHIEENHIDNESTLQYNNTKEIENATCLPLSYVLRFYTNKVKVEEDADDIVPNGHSTAVPVLPHHNVIKIQSPPPPPIVTTQLPSPSIVPAVSSSPQGSELGEDLEEENMLEDSNDSWTLAEEYSSEYILKHGSKMTTPVDGNVEKPFACPVPGCKKRYKNVNGIKYHSKNGHKTDGRIYKNFKCHCGKSYKTSQGLKTHTLLQHHTSGNSTHHTHTTGNSTHHTHTSDITTMTRIQDGDHQTDVLQVPSSRIKALTLKHIEALGVPVKTFVLSRNRTPPPSPLPTSNINIINTAVKDSNNNSNVLEINTTLAVSNTSTIVSHSGSSNSHVSNGTQLSPHYTNMDTLNNNTNTPNNQPTGLPMTPNTPSNPVSFVHATSTPISIPNAVLASSLLTPATSPSCSPASSYHSL